MDVCFLCDTKLNGKRTNVCSSITPHSNVPYPEKIAELLGDEVVIIVTPADHMCRKCTSLLIHMDKLEIDMKLVKNAMLSCIQKKYGILLHSQDVNSIDIVNGHLKTEEQLEQGQGKVSNSPTVEVSPTVTTATVVKPVQTPLKLLKTQQQQQPQPQQQQSANKIKIYRCCFCTFQSKDLGQVRIHIRSHTNKKEPEKPIHNQAVATNAITSVPRKKKQIYRCQVCSESFDVRSSCIDHIERQHNQPTPSTSYAGRETKDSYPVTTKIIKLEPSKTQENNQQADCLDVDEKQQENNKGTVDTDMMLNDYVPTKESADVKQEEEIENSQEDKTVKEDESEIKPDPALEEEDEKYTAVFKKEEADPGTLHSIKEEVDEDNANEDLDIESMLTAIHNENPTNNENKQNKV